MSNDDKDPKDGKKDAKDTKTSASVTPAPAATPAPATTASSADADGEHHGSRGGPFIAGGLTETAVTNTNTANFNGIKFVSPTQGLEHNLTLETGLRGVTYSDSGDTKTITTLSVRGSDLWTQHADNNVTVQQTATTSKAASATQNFTENAKGYSLSEIIPVNLGVNAEWHFNQNGYPRPIVGVGAGAGWIGTKINNSNAQNSLTQSNSMATAALPNTKFNSLGGMAHATVGLDETSVLPGIRADGYQFGSLGHHGGQSVSGTQVVATAFKSANIGQVKLTFGLGIIPVDNSTIKHAGANYNDEAVNAGHGLKDSFKRPFASLGISFK